MMKQGKSNLITDVSGFKVGNAHDEIVRSGVTVLSADKPFTAAVQVMGGAPGTRETDLLAPDKSVQKVDAIVLSGGSALGLSAASGVADYLRANGQGYDVAGQKVPIVPSAIIFDLLNGGDKDWATNPYPSLGQTAIANQTDQFELGSIGAGYGATTAQMMGGLGSASLVLPSGHTVGALVVVNALGSATIDGTGHFWAAPWEMNAEFGNRGTPQNFPEIGLPVTKAGGPRENTTIAIVATDADLNQAQAQRLATAAHDGMARALVPSHTPMDGDLVFAAATGEKPVENGDIDALFLGHAAAITLSRAIARGVYHASSGIMPSWTDLYR